jgi:hypothetical protein
MRHTITTIEVLPGDITCGADIGLPIERMRKAIEGHSKQFSMFMSVREFEHVMKEIDTLRGVIHEHTVVL